MPDVKVSGILSGTPYPELTGSYQIVSSSGFVAEVDFSGKRLLGLGGKKNHVSAALYRVEDKERKKALYQIEGAWNDAFTIHDVAGNRDVETYNTNLHKPTRLIVPPIEQQDAWESRRAWAGVINALSHGDMQATSDEKSKVEQAQRNMRKQEEASRALWQPTFFVKTSEDIVFQRLAAVTGDQHLHDSNNGFWRFDRDKAARARKPFHGQLTPSGPI